MVILTQVMIELFIALRVVPPPIRTQTINMLGREVFLKVLFLYKTNQDLQISRLLNRFAGLYWLMFNVEYDA